MKQRESEINTRKPQRERERESGMIREKMMSKRVEGVREVREL